MTQVKSQSERKKAAIIEAAIVEFLEQGFNGTSMDKISARANVSKRTVYNHFASKESLFTAITADVWCQALAATDFAYRPDRPLDEQLTAIAEQELELLSSKHFIDIIRLLFTEKALTPSLGQDAVNRVNQGESGLSRWIQAGIKDNRLIEVSPEFASTQFLSLLKAFAFWPQIVQQAPFPSATESQAIIESAVQMFLKQYQKDQ